jgi:hypothetical protein
MASEYADPPAPQTEVITTSTVNNTARIGAYTDRTITRRNVQPTVPVPGPNPPRSGSKTLGNIRRFYAEDKVEEKDQNAAATENVGVLPPPHSPNSWKIRNDAQGVPRSRDYYSNNGLIGQSFFDNQAV